jgi:hypothetical protein
MLLFALSPVREKLVSHLGYLESSFQNAKDLFNQYSGSTNLSSDGVEGARYGAMRYLVSWYPESHTKIPLYSPKRGKV